MGREERPNPADGGKRTGDNTVTIQQVKLPDGTKWYALLERD